MAAIQQKWGVVQHLQVEADTPDALRCACMIATVEHDRATCYAVVIGGIFEAMHCRERLPQKAASDAFLDAEPVNSGE